METVLVLDGNQRSALAATRSLGRRGVRVVVADDTRQSIAGYSRFAAESFQYPSPRQDPAAFVEALVRECARRRVDVLYPMSDVTMRQVLADAHRFAGVTVPFGPLAAYEQLTDKGRFFDLVRRLDLPMPATHFVRTPSELRQLRNALRFPVVIKPYRSQICLGGRWRHATVKYAETFQRLEAVVASTEAFATRPFLLQEYIPGEHLGVFALSDGVRVSAFFANRRIRDVPPNGGIVVLAESIPMDATLRDIAGALLAHVGWRGVAMVECKLHDGTPYILETNARFWASTQLAVDCGVDYPWLLFQLATGRQVDDVARYEERRRLRDLVGDIEHWYMSAAGIGLATYESADRRQRARAGFWKPLERGTFYEKNRWNDPGPFVLELARVARSLHPLRMLRHLSGRW